MLHKYPMFLLLLLELPVVNLTVAQRVEQFAACYGSRSFVFTYITTQYFCLSRASSIQSTSFRLVNIPFNIVLVCLLCVPTKCLYVFLFFFRACYMSRWLLTAERTSYATVKVSKVSLSLWLLRHVTVGPFEDPDGLRSRH
jgi:hypothetical protein